MGAAVAHAREVGGPALRTLTFHDRASILKAIGQSIMAMKDELYELSAVTGATKADSWLDIDGGVGVLMAYASMGRRQLPNAQFVLDGEPEVLAKDSSFVAQHVYVPRRGVGVHINAYNFPCWGMLEKLAPTLLAGVPAIVKPASQTAYLAEAVFRRVVDSGILPDGAVQLICGGVGDLFDHLDGQDTIAFTGSSAAAAVLRAHPAVVGRSTRFTAETDSLNASILGLAADPGTPECDLYVEEVVREITTKAGQKCTAIRRALVPAERVDAVVEALSRRLAGVVVGDPRTAGVAMGPLVSLAHRDAVAAAIEEIAGGADVVIDGREEPLGADWQSGAFMAPTVLVAHDPRHHAIHDVEAFGPVCTIVPYSSTDEAVEVAALGGGSLVASAFTPSRDEARALALGMASHHGRLLLVDKSSGRTSTGHGSPLPHLVHGGPGRAGGGEELGGVRAVHHYMQRTALQGSPDLLASVTATYLPGSARRMGRHPFQKYFDDLAIGDSLVTETRKVTIEDIERFADLTGDRFYAHMDEEAAKASPLFDGRVAHGYFVVAAAAGLFVWPEPGPVLANYGLEGLRFVTPVYPGDELKVTLTCKQKSERSGAGYGEVRWDTQVTNQSGAVVASYDVLTMVANRPGINGAAA